MTSDILTWEISRTLTLYVFADEYMCIIPRFFFCPRSKWSGKKALFIFWTWLEIWIVHEIPASGQGRLWILRKQLWPLKGEE